MARNLEGLKKGKKFKKGEVNNPHGRPKKMLSKFREMPGFEKLTISQINDVYQDMVGLTFDQLKEIFDDPNASALEKAVASAVKGDITNGNLSNIETILSRLFGRAQQKILHDGIPGGKITVQIIPPSDED